MPSLVLYFARGSRLFASFLLPARYHRKKRKYLTMPPIELRGEHQAA